MLFAVVSAAATAALLLGKVASRTGEPVLAVGAVVAGLFAAIGILLLARVVIVVERARRPR